MTRQRKDILLGTVISIAMLIVGYFIWRHENAVSQAEAQTNNQIAQQQADDISNELESLQQSNSAYQGSYFSSGPEYDTGATESSNDELATILEAFFGNQNNGSQSSEPSTGTQSSATSTGTQSSAPSTGTQSSAPSTGTQSNAPQSNVRLTLSGGRPVAPIRILKNPQQFQVETNA